MSPYAFVFLFAAIAAVATLTGTPDPSDPPGWVLVLVMFGVLAGWGSLGVWISLKLHRWAKKNGIDAPIH